MSRKCLFHGRKGSTLNLIETNVLLLSNMLASSVMTQAMDTAVAHRPGELKHEDANYSLESRRAVSRQKPASHICLPYTMLLLLLLTRVPYCLCLLF